MAGGIRASIWTDAAQSFVMMCSMLALMIISINKLGGVYPMVMKLHPVNLHYMDIFPSHVMDKGALMVGFFIVGWLFAATMSTADSQILSCTAAITRDLSLARLQTYWMTKGVTLFVTTVALLIALDGNKTVFQLVLIAWSALACAFGPLLFTLAVTGGKNINQPTAVAMMLCGLVGMFAWRYLEWNAYVYEILPGILCSFVPFFLHRLQGKLRSKF